MSTLPTVPTFTDGESSLAHLESLASAVSFLSSCDMRPMWHFYKTATQSIASSTWTTVAYNYVAADSDGVYAGGTVGEATIVTQGYYVVEACAGALTSAAQGFYTRFLWTAGTHNANYSSGTSLVFGQTGGETNGQANQDAQLCFSAPCPYVCYPGDTIQAQVFSTGAISLAYNENVSYLKGRFAANFTGYWLRTGS